jgi:hypothetical protein
LREAQTIRRERIEIRASEFPHRNIRGRWKPMSSERIMTMFGFRSPADAKKLPTRRQGGRMQRNIMSVNDVDSFHISRWFIINLRLHGRDRRAMFSPPRRAVLR